MPHPQPMRAVKLNNIEEVRFPCLATPKIDGVRAWVYHRQVRSKKMKAFKCNFIQNNLSDVLLEGFDGEIIVPPTPGDTLIASTSSAVNTINWEGPFQYLVFDWYNEQSPSMGHATRFARLTSKFRECQVMGPRTLTFLKPTAIFNIKELEAIIKVHLDQGYEGTMVRQPDAPYKFGTSTAKEQGLVKLKPVDDDDAIILDVLPLYQNNNEATIDERGFTKRSSHQENKVPLGMMGAFLCQSPKWPETFTVGTGVTDAQRLDIWTNRDLWKGKCIEYSFQSMGSKDRPRNPVFKRIRLSVES